MIPADVSLTAWLSPSSPGGPMWGEPVPKGAPFGLPRLRRPSGRRALLQRWRCCFVLLSSQFRQSLTALSWPPLPTICPSGLQSTA